MSNDRNSYDLFMGALDVTNEALENLRETPVIGEVVKLMDKESAGRKFGVAVYGDDASNPHDYFTVRIQNRNLQLVAHGKDAPDIDWKVSTDYLRKINDEPEEFVDNPMKLDIDWLKHRLKDAA